MRIYITLLLFISTSLFINLTAQNTSWNLLLEKKVGRFLGSQVYETDSFYYVVGTSIDTFNTLEQGFSVSKVSKKDAKLVATKHYEEKSIELDFNYCNNGVLLGNEIYFPQKSRYFPYFIALYKINIYDLEVHKVINIPLPEEATSYPFFLDDFHAVQEKFFILASYNIGGFSTSTYKGVNILIKYNHQTKISEIIKYTPITAKTVMRKISNLEGNIITFGTVVGTQLATGKMFIAKMDEQGNLMWQYETPSLSPIHNVKDIHPINEKEVLLASDDTFFDYTKSESLSRWTVTRYDVENKKIIWSSFWDEPRKPNVWFFSKIIKTKNEGEYFLMANDYIREDTMSYTTGKIVKFNEDGNRLWQKIYYYHKGKFYNNDFYNIISTQDQNYLIVGNENVITAPWLVKIDEDGNILPIDTTSATTDQDVQNTIPEIKIYPNPASHSIIINQGEITDMTYQLTDMSGAVVKSIPLQHAHHHVVWDISDVAAGTYVLTMWQGGKVIGSQQQVVVR